MVNRTYDNNTVIIFDTTLRDGEQSPGATLSSAEKLEIARQLSRLGVDVIEAGFPAASPDDLKAVQRIAQEVGTEEGPVICGLARAVESDILTAWEGVKDAAKPRIHTFLGTSPEHLQMLRIDQAEGLERIRKSVTLAKSLCDDVEFSPMDAGRTDVDYIIQACAVAVECGATTLNIPDTVGYVTPEEWGETIASLIAETPGAGPGTGVVWSVHCHNDLGMATANTLAAVQNGARQVEVTINGIGERAGNTSLEEVVMAIETRKTAFPDVRTNIDTKQIIKSSRMVSNYMGMPIQPNKAIVGANAFAHESGIHQDGMLKDANTFEIMTPTSVGLNQSKLVLGKHSGRHALRVRLEELGYVVEGEELKKVFKRFKQVADAKKTVTDADLEALMTDSYTGPQEFFTIEALQVTCGSIDMPTATVRMQDRDGNEYISASVGTGPVDASYQAVDDIVKADNVLLEYSVHSVTEGIDALGEVTVRISPPDSDKSFGGYGAHSDVIVASVKAYVVALNRMIAVMGLGDVKAEGDAATVGVNS